MVKKHVFFRGRAYGEDACIPTKVKPLKCCLGISLH